MSDFSNDNPNSTKPVSPALAEAGNELSQPKGNNLRQSSFKDLLTATSLIALIDGDNPPSVGPAKDTPGAIQGQSTKSLSVLQKDSVNGLRVPSSFAQQVEQRLRESTNDVGTETIDIPSTQPGSHSSRQVDQVLPKMQPAQLRPPILEGQQARQVAPVAVAKKREIIITMPKATEVPKPKAPEQNEVTKDKIVAERDQELPKRLEVSTVSGMEKAMEKAAKLGVPVVIYFGATWCGPCQSFKRDVLSKMEGSGPGKVPAMFVHVDVDQAGDGGQAIARAAGVRRGNSVPELSVLAINPDTGKFRSVHHQVGGSNYQSLKNNIPKPISADYVAQNREKLVQNVRQQFSQQRQSRR